MVHPHARPLARKGMLERLALELAAAGQPVHLAIGKSQALAQGFLVLADDHVQPPLARQPVAVFDHFRDLVGGVDMHQGKRHMSEKGLTRQPEQHRAVLADRPEHAQVAKLAIGFAQQMHAFGFQFIELIHESHFLDDLDSGGRNRPVMSVPTGIFAPRNADRIPYVRDFPTTSDRPGCPRPVR